MHTSTLRLPLLVDAAASGAAGLLLAALPGALGRLLGLPPALLLGVGLFLLVYAAGVGLVGMRAAPARRAVQAVILVNVMWAVDSALFAALAGPVFGLAPSGLGTAFVLAQAALVLGFAAWQAVALRRAGEGVVLGAPRAA